MNGRSKSHRDDKDAINVNLHVTVDDISDHGPGMDARLDEILEKLNKINGRVEKMARAMDDLNEGFTALEAAIEEISKEIGGLVAGGDGATHEELVALQGRVKAATEKLTAMDPNPGSTPGGTPPGEPAP